MISPFQSVIIAAFTNSVIAHIVNKAYEPTDLSSFTVIGLFNQDRFTKGEIQMIANKHDADILLQLVKEPYTNQRILAERSGHSLGIVNRTLKSLVEAGYLNAAFQLTEAAKNEIAAASPRRAIILAAGFGMRMVPINAETPKAFVEVDGEPLIERIIRQLHEVGVSEITVVVGFMKERFDYLIDAYGVELIVNRAYAAKNNLFSVSLAADRLQNCYLVPCDVWCKKNPFAENELYSWYMVSNLMDAGSSVRVNRKGELSVIAKEADGNSMIGIGYLTGEASTVIARKIRAFSADKRYDGAFWEEALYEKDRMIVNARVVSDVVEINTYEQLRDLDGHSNQLQSEAIHSIADALKVTPQEIQEITVLKKGMTNRSFSFTCRGQKYIMRIPGEGTDQLINRKEEAAVYRAIDGLGICDDLVYINPENGFKITKALPGARVCDPKSDDDLKKCMQKLKAFHERKLKVDHIFDIYEKIDFYESLWEGQPSAYKDYAATKANVFALKAHIDRWVDPQKDYSLTHIDAVPDNFLFAKNAPGAEEIRLIDWEYAAMQDPDVDIAMFCIYALYDRKQADHLIDIYYHGECTPERRYKIYCYIASCGLLWSNWCEYKRNLGVEFGEYSLKQYRFAKDFYHIVKEAL